MKLLIGLITLLFFSTAFAGILIEPQIGYNLSSKYSGTVALSGPSTGTLAASYSSKGTEIGARLGYEVLGFMAGLNYGHSSGSNLTISSTTGTLKTTNVGIFAGYNLPILLRGWFAYNFSADTTISSNEFKGSSTEFGVGFTGLPFLSVNFIYRMYDYSKVTTSGTTYNSSNFSPKELELAVSAPFNLF